MRDHDLRGNTTDRRRRRLWLLDQFGDGVTCPCFDCGKALTYQTLTVDRIVPGAAGGRYTRDNIRPACFKRNVSAWQDWLRDGVDPSAVAEIEASIDLSDEELAAAYFAFAEPAA